MSEEERKAIGHLECLLDYGILSSEDEEPMKTVLNLIKKQQKEIEKLEQERKTLTTERDYYKARYLEFNNAFIQGGKKLTED